MIKAELKKKKQKTMENKTKGIIGAVIFIIMIWFYFGGGLEQQAAKQMEKIEDQVALDAVKQYEIAKRSGSAMDAYLHSGLAAAAYLQAQDEVNYKKWKDIEKEEAKNAGMPEL
jgi:hypothetical protein